MTQEEIITRLVDQLDFHLRGEFGSVHQNPYKNDIFKLFREAYISGYCEHTSRPLLTGDALRDALQVRWNTGGADKKTQRQKLANDVLTMWDEWRYAWDRMQNY
jgi:hypothetical protein